MHIAQAIKDRLVVVRSKGEARIVEKKMRKRIMPQIVRKIGEMKVKNNFR
jgi:hypothetical protein